MRVNSKSSARLPLPLRLAPSIIPPRGGAHLSSVQAPCFSSTHAPASQPSCATRAGGGPAAAAPIADSNARAAFPRRFILALLHARTAVIARLSLRFLNERDSVRYRGHGLCRDRAAGIASRTGEAGLDPVRSRPRR